ncbi:unnamed protein product [Chironomus riparius]|uniref:Phosphatidate cytidylyltransferase n=1 Tax=Chironomus riparius TaxID=315576 RepID=A0A9N9S5L5_9DIPT|nr:unnamed protein product [Chironomus riparius]
MSVDSKVSKYTNKNKNLLCESVNLRRKIIKNETFTNESDHMDSEYEDVLLEKKYIKELTEKHQEGTKKVPKFLSAALKGLPERWKNWVVRLVFAIIMISAFCVLIAGGPLALMGLVIAIQVKCFQEIMQVGFHVYRVDDIPWFRQLTWYLLCISNYFFYGEYLFDYVGQPLNRIESLQFLIKSHRFISYCLYLIGFTVFVMLLVKKYNTRQFHLFAWAHVAILITVMQSYLLIRNIFDGLIWFITPSLMIIMNDIMAYVFGFFFGRTPLIKLSPKKTWEGYLGGGIATVVFGSILSYFLLQYPYFTCPVDYSEDADRIVIIDCTPGYLYQTQEYIIIIGNFQSIFNIQPFVLHSFSLSIFSSVVGPFGGFFASGFKRAFKIKDFGDSIPGHGGIMDRFDCHVLMATFVYVYISSFIRDVSPQKILTQVYNLKLEEQLSFYYQLENFLASKNLLN